MSKKSNANVNAGKKVTSRRARRYEKRAGKVAWKQELMEDYYINPAAVG